MTQTQIVTKPPVSARGCPSEEDLLGAGDEAAGLQGHGALRGLLHPVRLLLRLLQHALQVTALTAQTFQFFHLRMTLFGLSRLCILVSIAPTQMNDLIFFF